MTQIPHNKPSFGKEEIKALERVVKSGCLIMGEEVDKLQESFKKYLNVRYALATNSGISAVHLSLIALGVGKNDEVILPTYTFSGLLNTIYYQGAIPILVDIEKKGFTIDPTQVKKKINKRTKVIIVPHTFGIPAEINVIKKLGIPVIEDCAHALGSFYNDKPLGSSGDISIFSFYATKMIATGQGGIFTTNNKKYFDHAYDIIRYDQRKDYKIRYNYQQTDLAACLGNVQFKKLGSFIDRRRANVLRYINVLEKYNQFTYWPKRADTNLNNYRFIIQFDNQKVRDELQNHFSQKGVSTIVPIDNYQLLHNLLKMSKRDFPNAETLTKTTLSLPIYPSLTTEDNIKIATILDSLCKKYLTKNLSSNPVISRKKVLVENVI